MKTFRRTSKPDTIKYNNKTYEAEIRLSAQLSLGRISKRDLKRGKHILVEVLSSRLKGKLDLHGNPYKPSVFVYETKDNDITEITLATIKNGELNINL